MHAAAATIWNRHRRGTEFPACTNEKGAAQAAPFFFVPCGPGADQSVVIQSGSSRSASRAPTPPATNGSTPRQGAGSASLSRPT